MLIPLGFRASRRRRSALKATAPWLAGLAALSVTVTTTPSPAAPLLWPAVASAALGQAPSGGLLPLMKASREESRPADPFAAARKRDEAFNRLTNTEKEQARTYLEKGRAAIAQGDSTAALHWFRKAKATGAEFAPGEYSPRELGDALRQAGVSPQELAATIQAPPMAPITPEQAAAADRSSLPALLQSPLAAAPRSNQQTPFGNQIITNPHLIPANDHPLIGNRPAAVAGEPRVGDFGDTIRRLPAPQQEKKDNTTSANKTQALRLIAQARASMDRGDLAAAHRLASQARDLQVPDDKFAASETRPWAMLLEVENEMNRRGKAVVQAGAIAEDDPAGAPAGFPVQRALHQPETDTTRNMPATNLQPIGQSPAAAPPAPSPRSPGRELYEAGLNALQRQDRETALKYFRDAWKHETTLDPATRQSLQDHLGGLQTTAPRPAPAGGEPGRLEEISEEEQMAFQRLSRETNVEIREAEALMNVDPLAGLQRVKDARERVLNSELSPRSRKQLLTIVDRTLEKMEQYVDQNRANIELNAESKEKLEQIDRERAMRLASQDRLAELVEEFNALIDQERWPEAERVAMQAHEIAPNEEVVASMIWKSRFIKAYQSRLALRSQSEQNFMAAMTNVEESGIPFDDNDPLQFGDATEWGHLTKTRRQWMLEQGRRLSPNELKIQDALKEPVDVRFNNQPLSEVMDILSAAVAVNFRLNEEGLAAEGASSDIPVTIQLREPVSLRSALNLILEPLHLSYVIRNEVLEITSETVRRSDTVTKVYNVGDLVIPIPNFVPSYNMGLPGAIRAAHSSMPYGQPFGGSGTVPLTVMAQNEEPAAIDPIALAQVGPNAASMANSGRNSQPLGFGPGGVGAGVAPDYDSLIELITATVAPESWDEVGGPGAIHAGSGGNLSLVISQTQEIHEQIADLLEQLRRLQDLQVTIEVRFITINDNFFERIGIDFDFDIDDNSARAANGTIPDDTGPSVVVGLDPTGNVTTDGDLSFTQASFSSAVPQFGGFDPATAANFGFAILSDIEVFFLIQAAQGDSRTNVLQAPKVTLFNGQSAFVSDTTQRPFVTSVIPVVGDFAAAHAPVIVVLSEGTSLSVQAVVSNDRRFVRLTLVPFFSEIGEVEEFTFNGKKSVTKNEDDETVATVEEGTTVQLPTFAFTSVTTTVSVPDGGTVLLGGIKRLQEGRNERGLPLLSKVPYVSRLFKNVGIGRTTQSLMMMVTPRIIIQEEEESRLGIDIAP
jgi:general secretion pathway protein D